MATAAQELTQEERTRLCGYIERTSGQLMDSRNEVYCVEYKTEHAGVEHILARAKVCADDLGSCLSELAMIIRDDGHE